MGWYKEALKVLILSLKNPLKYLPISSAAGKCGDKVCDTSKWEGAGRTVPSMCEIAKALQTGSFNNHLLIFWSFLILKVGTHFNGAHQLPLTDSTP